MSPQKKSPKVEHRQVLVVRGMTCRSCEILVEHKLKTVPGVTEVRTSERRGEVEVISRGELPKPPLEALREALKGSSYRIAPKEEGRAAVVVEDAPGWQHWFEVGGMLVLVFALYAVLKGTGIFSLSRTTEGALSLSAIFVTGLTAATSTCLAVVGGLLLSVSAKWAENISAPTRWEKFQPLFLFNIGRLLGYFVLGGLVGLLGSTLNFSPNVTGFLTVAIAVVMVILGLNILKILPKQYCTLPLPRRLRQKIARLADSRNPGAALLLGALTFFLPCGFTQSMQLLALGSGSFLAGAMIMLVFALGTLPALLGISIMSSMAEGNFRRHFLQFSGTLVLLLGLFNFNSGLLLAGYDASSILRNPTASATDDPNVKINANGQQIIMMTVTDQGYSPAAFTVEPNRETWIYATAPSGVSGCASMLVDASHNLSVSIKRGENWLGPVRPTKNFVVTCSMGMLRADIYVKRPT